VTPRSPSGRVNSKGDFPLRLYSDIMLQSPVVSVVLNTYNRAHLVNRAIESVLSQSVEDIELIVVDDGSTDGTSKLFAEIKDERLRYIWQVNQGLAAARNAGIKASIGAWITFLDDDDEVEPDWLHSFLEHASDNTGLVFAGHKRVDSVDGRTVTCVPSPLGVAFGNATGSMLAGTWMIRRSVLDLVGGFAEDVPTLVQSEFLLRAIPACHDSGLSIITTESTHFRYTVAPAHLRPTLTPELTIDAATKIMDRHHAIFARDKSTSADWHSVIGVAAARLRRWDIAHANFAKAAVLSPLEWRRWSRLALSWTPARRRIWRAN
jgi:glycosyltransferase involved in cell wall biosynthesis